MQETTYGLRVVLRTDYQTAIERATAALKTEGFGVLTTIDVQQTLRAKLNREFRKYVILGACNPVLADRALHPELEIGLLLPCNVIVYEIEPGETVVAAMAPLAALGRWMRSMFQRSRALLWDHQVGCRGLALDGEVLVGGVGHDKTTILGHCGALGSAGSRRTSRDAASRSAAVSRRNRSRHRDSDCP